MRGTRLSQIVVLVAMSLSCVSAFEFKVGGPKGWSVPSLNDTRFYDTWASNNRFQLGDTLRFEYKKDSVLEVSEEDYTNCNSSQPGFFSNTGDTVLKLDRHRPFFFISGIYHHCRRGQRIVVKVIAPTDSPSKSSASVLHSAASIFVVVALFFVSSVAFVLV